MADNAANFIGALGVATVDVLGHSIGGYVAQTLALRHRRAVRRLILAGTGPRAGEPSKDPKVREWADSTDPQTGESSLDAFLYLFFRPSPTSQAAGKAFWERRHRRKQDADRASTPQTMAAQRAAIIAWSKANGEPDAQPDNIIQPTLVLNGNHDIMIPTINSYNLSQRIPRAELIIYPDSGHGALFQFPELFVAHGTLFWTPQPDHKQRATWNASFESDDQGGSPHRVGRRLLRSRNEAAGRSGGGESHL
jgi:pimeloyl-ACP methyl ester carboxylesterase